jgi:transcriptional regulator
MAFNATFNNISVISWRNLENLENPEKTTDLSQVTEIAVYIYLF